MISHELMQHLSKIAGADQGLNPERSTAHILLLMRGYFMITTSLVMMHRCLCTLAFCRYGGE